MLSIVIAAGSLFNAGFQKDLSFVSCRQVEVKKACTVVVDALGFGSKPFTLFSRQENDELKPLKTERLDVTGRKRVTLKFDDQGMVSIVLVLFDRDKIIAMDGSEILVVPGSTQMGEQTRMLFPEPPYTDEFIDGEFMQD